MKKIITIIIMASSLYSGDIYLNSPTQFERNGKLHNLKGRKIIILELNTHNNGAGNFYAINRNGSLWLSGPITGGGIGYQTRPGIYNVNYKKRYYMSKTYPDYEGVNNMDYSLFFSNGIALHEGNVKAYSHGCVHSREREIKRLFRWSDKGTKIIVTNQKIRRLMIKDLKRIGELNKEGY